jgi:chromosome segregation and condensation protein ScpB
MGKIKKGVVCEIVGCAEKSVRSLSKDTVSKALNDAGLQLRGTGNRAYLCEKHYKVVKKYLKKTRKEELTRLGKPF